MASPDHMDITTRECVTIGKRGGLAPRSRYHLGLYWLAHFEKRIAAAVVVTVIFFITNTISIKVN